MPTLPAPGVGRPWHEGCLAYRRVASPTLVGCPRPGCVLRAGVFLWSRMTCSSSTLTQTEAPSASQPDDGAAGCRKPASPARGSRACGMGRGVGGW